MKNIVLIILLMFVVSCDYSYPDIYCNSLVIDYAEDSGLVDVTYDNVYLNFDELGNQLIITRDGRKREYADWIVKVDYENVQSLIINGDVQDI